MSFNKSFSLLKMLYDRGIDKITNITGKTIFKSYTFNHYETYVYIFALFAV